MADIQRTEFEKEHLLYVNSLNVARPAWQRVPHPINPAMDIWEYLSYLRKKYGKERSDSWIDQYYRIRKIALMKKSGHLSHVHVTDEKPNLSSEKGVNDE
ncbi:MAG: hypothetical protein GOVbin1630_39 [Prokaryotic dsDNA virus sp.]|nr:MAG: hypothetical protein GOVbin1630_39 [Prokaryotic dsDNA virus sp.]|tara:strand:+ start:442 stop:741 length:300 start_codon:yes stop_codon:yes gene_type:complete